MTEEAGLPGVLGIQEASLLALLMLMLRLYFTRMGSMEKSLENIQKSVITHEKTSDVVRAGVAQLQERREDDTRAMVNTLHEITLALQKISSQSEAHTKLIERLFDRVDRRD